MPDPLSRKAIYVLIQAKGYLYSKYQVNQTANAKFSNRSVPVLLPGKYGNFQRPMSKQNITSSKSLLSMAQAVGCGRQSFTTKPFLLLIRFLVVAQTVNYYILSPDSTFRSTVLKLLRIRIRISIPVFQLFSRLR